MLRKSNNLTREQFAEKLGYKYSTVQRWEDGSRKPTTETILEIANMFNLDFNSLLSTDLTEVVQVNTETPFSRNIVRYRKEVGLSQEELAERLNISLQMLRDMENGRKLPMGNLVPKLCEVLGISEGELVEQDLFTRSAEEVEFLEGMNEVRQVLKYADHIMMTEESEEFEDTETQKVIVVSSEDKAKYWLIRQMGLSSLSLEQLKEMYLHLHQQEINALIKK